MRWQSRWGVGTSAQAVMRSRKHSSLHRWHPPSTMGGCGSLFLNTLEEYWPISALHDTQCNTHCIQLGIVFHDGIREGLLELKTGGGGGGGGGGWMDLGCNMHSGSPLQQLPHHVIGWVGFVYCRESWLTAHGERDDNFFLWSTMHPHADRLQDRGGLRGEKREACRPALCCCCCRCSCVCVRVRVCVCVCVCVRAERTHMLNATYIWYSSIASTNCPHESKSVPFLKLACHFWIVLLTSDMLAGRVLAALSGQHSRGGDSSTGLRRRRRRRRQPGYLLSEGAQMDHWHPDQALSCLLTLISHPQYRGSPARSSRCACFGARGRPGGRQQDVWCTALQWGNKWSSGV